MSGGHFDHEQWRFTDIAQQIEKDIALALKPKPQMIHEDYWVIYEADSPYSCHHFLRYATYQSYEEAEDFLRRYADVSPADPKYRTVNTFFKDADVVFQSNKEVMTSAKEGQVYPVLYGIHHAEYNRYPYDEEVLELTPASIESMKEAYRQIRIARIYADRVDWMMSGDDDEDTFQERLKKELEEFEEEFRSKDWTKASDEEDD